MKKIIIGFLIAAGMLSAATLPVVETTKIIIKQGEFSTISFPFEIRHIEKSPFVTKTTLPANAKADSVINSEALLNASSLPQPTRAKKGKAKPKNKNIQMKQGKNKISIFPYKLGSTELIVYGHDSIDMHIHLIVRKDAGADHFAFKNYRKNNKEKIEKANRFEMASHEKAISKLIKYVYNNKVPDGYSQARMSKTYNRKGLRFRLHKKVVGEKYQVNEWILKNTAKGRVTLYEEMFYIDGVYAITFDNNVLNKGESTRMLVVQKRDKG